MKTKKHLILAFALMLVLMLTSVKARAAEIVDSGQCGDNLTWTLDEEGTLTISGEGEMWDCTNKNWIGQTGKTKAVVIEEGVTSIGAYAFYSRDLSFTYLVGNSQLATVKIADSVTSIGTCAFSHCNELIELTIPDSIVSIGNAAFSSCEKLETVELPQAITSISPGMFNQSKALKEIIIPDSVLTIEKSAFYECTSLTSVTIGNKVEKIMPDVFFGCKSLTSLVIPDSVTYLGQTLNGCESLTTLVIGNSITNIYPNTFMGCGNLTDVVIGNSVERIWDAAFSGCEKLARLTLPVSLRIVDHHAFSGCDSLSDIYYQGTNSQWWNINIDYNTGNSALQRANIHFLEEADKIPERLAGSNRYETATKLADKMKAVLGKEKFDAVVLANGYNFADALSGSYLAAMKDAPILLTWIGKDKYNYLNEYTVSYVKENLAEGGTVYILGGTSAVPQMVDDLLEGYNVKRLAGENRFETNLLILKEAGVKAGDEVLVCTATGFADSLSASAAGKPILLVHKKLNDSQKAYLGTLQNCSYTMIGGTSAVSDAVLAEFNAYGATSRLAGGNRFETSVKVAEKYFYHTDGGVVLAYAKDFPDGLCGGPLAYAKGHPLILTMTKGEAKAAEYVKANDIREGLILGGEKLISNDTVLDMFYN